ncbi:hypothetical protein T492DRAFT_889248 [Pavlovales sp. CCMP2436]|nr:hypothetical protein T492DRAFT_889248 [Pavlovales sp. CCMP2436]
MAGSPFRLLTVTMVFTALVTGVALSRDDMDDDLYALNSLAPHARAPAHPPLVGSRALGSGSK